MSTGARAGRAAAKLFVKQPGHGSVALPTQKALGQAGKRFLGHFGGALARIGHQISAIVFLVFGLAFGAPAIASWYAYHHQSGLAHHAAASMLAAPRAAQVEFLLALLFLYFGVTSWAKASRRP